ncbi:HAD family hydrolase [Georgenia sp. TF02-10]|uniref:HAD family hydrolase n=1 Tax=Georgenia sp. TF02-10 TaxID=2917725 RepID=UPI001FA715B3|nr:HAD family hydrolase [Georgenia sp. TF02-10]UNX56218.1 HAD family hydrolase [Georgenia sp. TF02-10]
MTDNAPGAALLDADGTLVDSNYLHVDAWSQAFDEVGHPVESWRIHRCIGMGSDLLLPELLGTEGARAVGQRAKEVHARVYEQVAHRQRRLDGVPELVRALRAKGVRVVVSTSAAPNELERIRKVLDLDGEVDGITAAADVEEAKPAPDLVQAALTKAGVPADRAVFVGDAVWDAQACGRAGVSCVGVLTGGISEPELREAGAVAVYESVAHLLAELDGSPLARLWSD